MKVQNKNIYQYNISIMASKSKKAPSKKQMKARSAFKKMIAKAKVIKKENPTMKWTDCVKEAAKK